MLYEVITERRLVGEYRALIDGIADRLTAANLAAGVELARAAGEIGGYGPVKLASVDEYRAQLPGLQQAFEAPATDTP